uniref:hypothetical protein n=1 Tax=Salmonella sp. TaxID=599 RepID=UPI002343186C|nr:hypothetical protein [Salmonella sp.]
MGSCAAPSAKGDDKFITTDYLQQCPNRSRHLATYFFYVRLQRSTLREVSKTGRSQPVPPPRSPAFRRKH